MEPFDLTPVTDIPIRQAVEEGALKMNKELSLYIISTEWNGHPAQTPVIAGLLEEGRSFAVWVGRNHSSTQNVAIEESESADDMAIDPVDPSPAESDLEANRGDSPLDA